MIIAQIPWASAGAARSQAKREETPGGPDITKEEKLLASLLSANQDLVDVFKCYNDLEAAANAEQEKRGYKRGRAEQKPETTVSVFRSWRSYPFDVSVANPVYLPRGLTNPRSRPNTIAQWYFCLVKRAFTISWRRKAFQFSRASTATTKRATECSTKCSTNCSTKCVHNTDTTTLRSSP